MPGGSGKITKFSGEGKDNDWQGFRVMFVEMASFYAWTPEQQISALKISMTGRASQVTRHISLADKTITEALDLYEEVFLPPSSSTDAMVKFKQAHQEDGENVKDFGSRLLNLFYRAYPELSNSDYETNADLIYTYCAGFRDRGMRFRVYNPKPQKFSDAMNKAANDEASLAMCYDTQPGTSSTKRVLAMDTGAVNVLGQRLTCWHCGATGHLKADCPVLKRKSASGNPVRRTGNYPSQVRNFYESKKKVIASMQDEFRELLGSMNSEEGEAEQELWEEFQDFIAVLKDDDESHEGSGEGAASA